MIHYDKLFFLPEVLYKEIDPIVLVYSDSDKNHSVSLIRVLFQLFHAMPE
jgi:hypothetical protein